MLRTRATFVTGFLALVVLVTPACLADVQVDREVDATADGRVLIENISGRIEVEAWERDQVQVTGTLGDDVEELKIETRGGTVAIEVEVPDGKGWGWGNRDTDATLTVRVPLGSDVSVEAVSASVEVVGVEGSVNIESVSGGVEVRGEASSINVETVSGAQTVEGGSEGVTLETVSGRLELRSRGTNISATSVSGGVRLDLGTVDRLEVESVSGDARIEAAVSSGGRVDVSLHSGDVRMTLPAETSAEIRAETHSGDIETPWGDGERTSKYGPGRKLRTTAGSGDARIDLTTFSGDIDVRN